MNNLVDAIAICNNIISAGYNALLAGGCVRDRLMCLEPKDYDIATNCPEETLYQLFPDIIPVGAQFGINVVVYKGSHYEVARFRDDGKYSDGRRPESVEFTDDLKLDASRRDFTINSMYMDVNGEIIDFFDGKKDIEQMIIRAVGSAKDRFAEDKLRKLRAIRFAAKYSFSIDPDTKSEINGDLSGVSNERIRDEITRMLTSANPGYSLDLLKETGILQVVLPEVAAMIGVEQPPEFHPEGDVFIHTKIMLDSMNDTSPILAWAVLLHDVGKPSTQTLEERIKFLGHEEKGAEIAEDILTRLKMSSYDVDSIVWLIENHMKVGRCDKMRKSKFKKLVWNENFDYLVELHRLDTLFNDRTSYDWIIENKDKVEPVEYKPDPVITGKDLLILGFKPGPIFSKIINEVVDLQLDGVIVDSHQAVEYVKKHYIY